MYPPEWEAISLDGNIHKHFYPAALIKNNPEYETKKPYKEFRLRAFYPNYFMIQQVLDEQPDNISPVDNSGFPLPELEYKDPVDHTFHLLSLKNTDVFILCQPDRLKASQYLNLLIASSNSDSSAGKEKEMMSSNI